MPKGIPKQVSEYMARLGAKGGKKSRRADAGHRCKDCGALVSVDKKGKQKPCKRCRRLKE